VTLGRLLRACDRALARYRTLVNPPDPRLVTDVERLRERTEAELRELESDSRSNS